MRARIADIIHHASQLSGVSVGTLVGKSREQRIVPIRQAIMFVASLQRQGGERAYSYKQIGRAIGRDHSTVIHGCDKAREIMQTDLKYRNFITSLIWLAGTSKPFASVIKIEPPLEVYQPIPAPLIVPERAPHIKKITLGPGELPDAAHKFHDAVGEGSAKLLEALAA